MILSQTLLTKITYAVCTVLNFIFSSQSISFQKMTLFWHPKERSAISSVNMNLRERCKCTHTVGSKLKNKQHFLFALSCINANAGLATVSTRVIIKLIRSLSECRTVLTAKPFDNQAKFNEDGNFE